MFLSFEILFPKKRDFNFKISDVGRFAIFFLRFVCLRFSVLRFEFFRFLF